MTDQLENIDSQNDDLEIADSPNDNEEETQVEEREEYSEREKSLYAQLQKERGFIQVENKWVKAKAKKEATEVKKTEEEPTNDAVLSRLETRGVMEADDQNYVLRFAKSEGISPIEALSDSIVQDRLKANNLARTSVEATPKSNNRANTVQNEVDVAVKKFEKDGTLPDGNPVLTSKILKRLSNRG